MLSRGECKRRAKESIYYSVPKMYMRYVGRAKPLKIVHLRVLPVPVPPRGTCLSIMICDSTLRSRIRGGWKIPQDELSGGGGGFEFWPTMRQ